MIGRIALIAGGALAAAGAALIATRAKHEEEAARDDDRWLTVTIAASREEVAPNGAPPQPLAELGDAIEFRLEPAPGDRGIELSARPRGGDATALREVALGDHREALRIALRESKQLIEAGEVLRIDPRPAGHRPQTPAGALVDTLARRSRGEGVL